MATKDDILKASTQAQQPQQTTPSAAQTQPQPSAEAETKQQPSQPSQPPISTGAATPPVQTTAGEATAQPLQTGIAAGKTLKNSTDKAETHLNKAYTQVTKGNEKESKDRAMTKLKEADDREQKRYRTKAILAALGDGIWKSHATLTLLAKQGLAPFGYNMIAPLKSWCWGSILFYPFKISRFS